MKLRGAAGEALDQLGHGLSFNLRYTGIGFFTNVSEKRFVHFDAAVERESLLLRVPDPKLEPLGQKSRDRSVQNAFRDGSGQSSLAGRFSLAVKLKVVETVRKSAQAQVVTAKAKVHPSDKTYD